MITSVNSAQSPLFGRLLKVLRYLAVLLIGLLITPGRSHAQTVPKLLRVTPADGATNLAPRSLIIFTFDQEMEFTPLIASNPNTVAGNYQFLPATVNNQLTGTWGGDRRTLTFQPNTPIPLNTTVTWTLNPPGTKSPIKSVSGQILETSTGSYQIAINSGGAPNEVCPPASPAPGTYTFTKFVQYLQTSDLDPVLNFGNPALVAMQVQSPPAGPAVTGGSLTFPSGTSKNLLSQIGLFRINEAFALEATMDVAYPVGNYVLRFNQTGEPERVITLPLPAAPVVIPKIENFAEAQAIDATKEFTLRWIPFTTSGAHPLVRVVITDEFSNRIFLAPNSCVPRTLDPASTSIVIPANYLRPGFRYQGQLIFGDNFYRSTSDIPGMNGNAFVQRSTLFTLKTIAETVGRANELCDPGIQTLGSYTVTKLIAHRQTSADEVVLQTGRPAVFTASLLSPPSGPAITNGSITLPDDRTLAITNQSGFFTVSGQFLNEPELESAFPLGTYRVGFQQDGQPAHLIPMTMPALPTAIPRINNYAAAQAIDSTRDFTLQWNALSPQGPGASIRLIITDERGGLIFMAPNPCVPRTLDPTATSVVIPADYFSPGGAYLGLLVFAQEFYNSTTDAPRMAGYGVVQRSTSFSLQASGGDPGPGTGTVAPAKCTNVRVLANGHPEFHFAGTAGKAYTIQRTGSLLAPTWSNLGPITVDASGTAVFEDTDPALKFPAFYRVVGN